jgi:phosphomannomutase
MAKLGDETPSKLSGRPVTAVTDYRHGAEARPRYLPAASLVELSLGDSGRVLVRPSGTEPKLKIYVDLRTELGASDDVWETEAALLDTASVAADEIATYLGLT